MADISQMPLYMQFPCNIVFYLDLNHTDLVPWDLIDKSLLVQVIAWRRTSVKPTNIDIEIRRDMTQLWHNALMNKQAVEFYM